MVEQYLRAVRTLIDALGVTLDDALERSGVPVEMRELVKARYEEETALPIKRANLLSGHGGPRDWFHQWDPSIGYYWRRQRDYLIDRLGWNKADIESLDDATDKILSHLEDPRATGPEEFNVRGLVMGYVQSGKTANYCALVAKAADAGYKLVIILSGVHNSLRLQTQHRIDRTLGLDPNGIQQPEPGKRWIALTSADLRGDFRPGTTNANVLQGNEHVVMVCKKNKTVLDRLIRWMENSAPDSLPALIIDDEADQASINTGGNRPPIQEETDLSPEDIEDPNAPDELDPSKINGRIRALIRSFKRISYVAYTATPFANILINHQAIDREVFEDLYPRDFIVTLPCPNGYAGAERLFGREMLLGEDEELTGLDVIELIPDHEAELLTPKSREVDTYEPIISSSLKEAFVDYILSSAAYLERQAQDKAVTMLIHTHYRKAVQNRLGDRFREFVSEIRQNWRYDRDSIRPVFLDRWNRRFRPVTAAVNIEHEKSFEQIEEYIDRLFRDPIPVLVLNSDSTDELDYDADPNLKAVVIGGNRLSRGLTLEGLLVSFYLRQTDYYDTLMQMGRWFGYREKYVDLTRIWTTSELSSRFRDLALAEEELRREIARYERENLTPLDFGPRIRTHPVMAITARNKMGAAQIIQQNFSGYLFQTTKFRLDDRVWLESNLNAGNLLLEAVKNRFPREADTRLVWSGIPWLLVDEFLGRYRFDYREICETNAIRTYLRAQARQDELIEWRVSLRELINPDASLGVEEALSIAGRPVNRISRTRLKNVTYSIGSLINPAVLNGTPGSGDEEIGLSASQLEVARDEARQTDNFPKALRGQRSIREGLLLLYPISPFSRPRHENGNRAPLFDNPQRDGCTVLGIAFSFPMSESAATIEYAVGSVGRQNN